jgi:hypothetical protein
LSRCMQCRPKLGMRRPSAFSRKLCRLGMGWPKDDEWLEALLASSRGVRNAGKATVDPEPRNGILSSCWTHSARLVSVFCIRVHGSPGPWGSRSRHTFVIAARADDESLDSSQLRHLGGSGLDTGIEVDDSSSVASGPVVLNQIDSYQAGHYGPSADCSRLGSTLGQYTDAASGSGQGHGQT